MFQCLKICALAVVTAVLATAGATASQLDQSFGTGGRINAPLAPDHASKAAIAEDGSVFFASSSSLVHVLPNGHLDKSFGNGGFAPITPPSRFGFSLLAVAVDSSGRPLVFGTAFGPPVNEGPSLYPPAPTSSAMAMRFQADGAPDPSFALEGVLIADFGLTGYYPTYHEYPNGWLPIANVSSARLDSQGRILMTVSGHSSARGSSTPPPRLLVRLDPNGSLDSSFAMDGVAPIPGETSGTEIATDQHGAITLAGLYGGGSGIVLNRFKPNGRADISFGPLGRREYARAGDLLAMATNRAGEIAVLGNDNGVKTILRLHSDGDPVRGFGRAGLRPLAGEPGRRSHRRNGVLLDRRGRVLILGVLENPVTWWGMQSVERLLPTGSLDRRFGRDGNVVTSFGSASYGGLLAMGFREGRLLTVGSGLWQKTRGRALFARYKLGATR